MSSQPPPAEAPAPLKGRKIGISISESEDMGSLGLKPSDINVITVDLARRLVSLGASVVLGHDWRPGGVMEAVARFAMNYKSSNAAQAEPILLNFLAAPDQAGLSASEMDELKDFVRIQTINWRECAQEFLARLEPCLKLIADSGIPWALPLPNADEEYKNLSMERAFHLLAMRAAMTEACDARIILGGKLRGYTGFAPGILEEAALALAARKPVLISSGLGGAAKAALERKSKEADDFYARLAAADPKRSPDPFGEVQVQSSGDLLKWVQIMTGPEAPAPKPVVCRSTSLRSGDLVMEVIRMLRKQP